MRWCITLGLLAALALGGSASADGKTYYRYLDARGRIHFVDSLERVPAAQRAGAVEVGTRKRGAVSRAGPSRRPSQPPFSQVQPARPARAHGVVIYTAPWCGWCRKALAWLDDRGVDYLNKDIEQSSHAREELIEKTGRTAIPVVEIGGELIRGFDPDRMNDLL